MNKQTDDYVIKQLRNQQSIKTQWSRVAHICVSKLTIIGSDNGLSPGRRQAVIWTNDGILLTGPLGTNFSEISIETNTFSFKKTHLKMSYGKWSPLLLGLHVLSKPKYSHNVSLPPTVKIIRAAFNAIQRRNLKFVFHLSFGNDTMFVSVCQRLM